MKRIISSFAFVLAACGGSKPAASPSSALVTIEGSVDSVDEKQPDVHLNVRAVSGTVSVDLAPKSYLEAQHMNIEAEDSVTVDGAKSKNGEVLAYRVVKDGDELQLRDKDGAPLWKQQ